jgi:hypothetical protein
MLATLLAKFKEKKPEEPEVKEAPVEKSASFTEFMHTPETKKFVDSWYRKKNPDNPKKSLFSKRSITNLLRVIHNNPTYTSDKAVRKEANDALKLLGRLDKYEIILAGLKAAPHGLMKILKKAA